jgi:hypothetical protein
VRESRRNQASEFIKSGSNGPASALGVLAHDKSNTLYVCSDDFSAAGIKIPGRTARSLKQFDPKTREPKGSIPTPGQATMRNDIVVANDGTACLGFFCRPHPTPQARREGIRGLSACPVMGGPGQAGTGRHRHSLRRRDLRRRRLVPHCDQRRRQRGTITKLQASRPLYHSDGLRPQQACDGRRRDQGFLELITNDGDNAKIETIKDGFEGPCRSRRLATRSPCWTRP